MRLDCALRDPPWRRCILLRRRYWRRRIATLTVHQPRALRRLFLTRGIGATGVAAGDRLGLSIDVR
jgi:hypothetical protein